MFLALALERAFGLEGQDELRGVQLVAIYKLIAKCHYIVIYM